jgi:WD40 repeat protein
MGAKDSNICHKAKILEAFDSQVAQEFERLQDEKKKERKNLKIKGRTAATEEEEKKSDPKKNRAKAKHISFQKEEFGVKVIEKLIHRGWITKIKYYSDLNYVISSSLDGFIHIHDIENLSFKENKTFALH